ncbi:septum site-determining protein Ssd [Nocardioides sp. GCM10027113]|uniref:septum site-determining protein Ssd n=1 Tax=unclassified Nocardioides TaxID=2615069 RepID=UPI00361D9859
MTSTLPSPVSPAVVPPPGSAPLFVTRDEALLDELLRLAAAAGITPDVAGDAVGALGAWASAPLVVVGADAAADLARLRPARRAGVHVVAWGEAPDRLFRTAVAVGAEDVSGLPGSAEWLVEQLTDLGDRRPSRALTIGVVGGSGGAGATTLACALGQLAARDADAAVVDLDPRGPGLDRVLGVEDRDGVRWRELCQTTGRLSARSLRESLPRRDRLGVLTWGGGGSAVLPAFAAREAVSAAQRGHAVVVLDLPRARDELTAEMAARCDRVLVVAVPSVVGVASTARVCSGADRSRWGLVVRGGGGVDERALSRVCGLPVLGRMADQRGLAESIDLGLGPVRSPRGPLGRTGRELLAGLGAAGLARGAA